MPLFKGLEPFRRLGDPKVAAQSRVFFCAETGEAFLTYQEYFDRTLLLNTSLWTCAVTGQDGLTFDEAIQSEKDAHNGFPEYVRRHMLFFVKRYFASSHFSAVVDDVFHWMQSRFFLKEWVKYYLGTKYAFAQVVKVEYKKNSLHPLDPSNYVYFVEVFDDIEGRNVVFKTTHDDLDRVGACSNRASVEQQLSELLVEIDGIYTVSDEKMEEMEITTLSFFDFFVGPDLSSHLLKDWVAVKDNPRLPAPSDCKGSGSAHSVYTVKEKYAKVLRARMQMARKNDWNFTELVEDTALTPSKELPTFSDLSLPPDVDASQFGDLLSTYAFLRAFHDELDLHEVFSFRTLLESVYGHSLFFNKFVRSLLQARMKCVAEEDFDEADVSDSEDVPIDFEAELNGPHGEEIKKRCKRLEEIRLTYGKSLQFMDITDLNLTEILRLNLETAGFCPRNLAIKVRREKRGHVQLAEDDLFQFSVTHPDVMQKLAEGCLWKLSPEERLSLYDAFVQTLLSYGKYRTAFSDSNDDIQHLLDQVIHQTAIQVQYEGDFLDTQKLLSTLEPFKFKRNGHSKRLENFLQDFRSAPSVSKCIAIAGMKFRYDYLRSEDRTLLHDIHTKTLQIKLEELVQKSVDLFRRMGAVHLGSDRLRRQYYFVYDLGVLFVEDLGDETTNGSSWKICSSYHEVYNLVTSLNPRGCRESRLLAALKLCIENIGRTGEFFGFTDGRLFRVPTSSNSEPKVPDSFEQTKGLVLSFGEKLYERAFLTEDALAKFSQWKMKLQADNSVASLFEKGGVSISYNEEELYSASNLNTFTNIQHLALALFYLINNIELSVLEPPFVDQEGHREYVATVTLAMWLKSLLTSTSFTQLNLFLTVIDDVLKWQARKNNAARCTRCSVRGPILMMTKCKQCNDRVHTDCLSEDEVAEYTCPNCVRRAAHTARRAPTRVVKDDLNEKENGFTANVGWVAEEEATTSRHSTRKRVRPRNDDFVYDHVDQTNGTIKTDLETSSISKRLRRPVQPPPRFHESSFVSNYRNNKNVRGMFDECIKVIQEAMKKDFGVDFSEPVRKLLPGYDKVIREPMDMRTMLNKVKGFSYDHPSQVWQDFCLMFSNCESYHKDGSYSKEARELEAFVRPQLETILGERLEPYNFKT